MDWTAGLEYWTGLLDLPLTSQSHMHTNMTISIMEILQVICWQLNIRIVMDET